MTQHFNGLSPAEAERLAMLAEEAAEVAQIAMKILRQGYESYHPHDPQKRTNRELLHTEMADMTAVWSMMRRAGDATHVSSDEVFEAMKKKLRYTHHQEG